LGYRDVRRGPDRCSRGLTRPPLVTVTPAAAPGLRRRGCPLIGGPGQRSWYRTAPAGAARYHDPPAGGQLWRRSRDNAVTRGGRVGGAWRAGVAAGGGGLGEPWRAAGRRGLRRERRSAADADPGNPLETPWSTQGERAGFGQRVRLDDGVLASRPVGARRVTLPPRQAVPGRVDRARVSGV